LAKLFETINWRFYIRAKTKDKAQVVLKRLEKITGKIKIISFKSYWKDNALFEVECTTLLQIKEPEKAIFNVLILVNQIGNGIDVVGPLLFEDELIEFSGNCTSPSIVGLEWFHFYLDNNVVNIKT
jgi:hypothetical protein